MIQCTECKKFFPESQMLVIKEWRRCLCPACAKDFNRETGRPGLAGLMATWEGEGKGKSDSSNGRSSSSCYVVTATYGEKSRQALRVHARCRQTFLLNPMLITGWTVYKYYGPIFARWSQSSRVGFRACKFLLADPIVGATGKGLIRSTFCILYLTLLSLLGVLLLVPCALVRLVIRTFTNPARS
jgi:hypothetical protein